MNKICKLSCFAVIACSPIGLGAQSLSELRVAESTARSDTSHVHDTLFGLDKPKHFIISAFIECSAFAVAQAAGESRSAALGAGLASVSLVAIGREVHDRRTKGLFSFGDLLWDALGAGAATVMLRHTYR